MIVYVETSALIDALTGPRHSLDVLTRLTSDGHRLGLSTIGLYEWLRGPRTTAELAVQEELFPSEDAIPFGPDAPLKSSVQYSIAGTRRGSSGRRV